MLYPGLIILALYPGLIILVLVRNSNSISMFNFGLDLRKPVFGACEQVRFKPAFSNVACSKFSYSTLSYDIASGNDIMQGLF